jgi:S1-C subfamily serine protease
MQSPHFRRRRIKASGLLLTTAIVFARYWTDAQVQPPSGSPPAPPINLPLQPDTSANGTPSAPPSPPSHETPSAAVESSVVKVFSTFRGPDFYKPWEKASPTEGGGSGVVIQGKRILTNAHVVANASEIQIQANQGGDKIPATVVAIAPLIDLAVLKLDDERFFDSHPALARAQELPDIRDTVTVYGYPIGGTSLSVTKGIVSRIEFTQYTYPVQGLRIQIDAAINPGNSGGPAVVQDRMIGLAFSALGGAQNIGYIIPSEEIELFLNDIADGHYDGKPAMYDHFQTLENPALRSFLKLDASVRGIVVHRPNSTDASYPLKEWDVVTKIGDTEIDDQGMILLKPNLRVRFEYLVQKVTKNGKVPLAIVRTGKETRIDLPVSADLPMAIPDCKGGYPSYFILGPVVFSEATAQVVHGLGKANKGTDWLLGLASSGSPLISRYYDKSAFPGERVVFVCSPFFPSKLSRGYSMPALQVVKTVNGHRIKNLANLVETLRDLTDEFVILDFDRRIGGETLVFPRKEMVDSTDSILNDNGVRSQGSPEMLAIWKSEGKK